MTADGPEHKRHLEVWIKAHVYRRRKDYEYFMGPRANIWQFFSRMEALYRCLIMLERERGVDLAKAKVLDVGCSDGISGLAKLMALNFSSEQLYGIDIVEKAIEKGREMYPGLNLYHGDATDMRFFDDQQFDMVMEGFCFCHIADDSVREKIAREMIRVTRVGGIYLFSIGLSAGSR